jgi:hypothetical protein
LKIILSKERNLTQNLKNTPMGKHNIKAKDLSKIGYVNNVSRSIAIYSGIR